MAFANTPHCMEDVRDGEDSPLTTLNYKFNFLIYKTELCKKGAKGLLSPSGAVLCKASSWDPGVSQGF